MLDINGIGLIYVNKTPYTWRAVAGERPEKRSGTSHGAVLTAFQEFMPGSLLLSQTIGVEDPFEWLMGKREAANYKLVRFSEPSAPAHFTSVARHGVRRLLRDYISDEHYLFTFDPDHAMLAFPVEAMKMTLDLLRTTGGPALDADDATFLASQCFDRTGPIADFRRLIVG